MIVTDSSVCLAWFLADEGNPAADRARQLVVDEGGMVPGIWWYEVRNALLMNVRRGRISSVDCRAAIEGLRDLPVSVDTAHSDGLLLEIAGTHQLTVYDASYLEVAIRRELAVASLDRRIVAVADTLGVDVVGVA